MRSELMTQSPAAIDALRTPRKVRRVRTVARLDAWDAPGGGEVQMHATEQELRRLGLDARPWRPWEDDNLRRGDVVHFFGSRPEFVAPIEALRRRGVRTVVSTIAWFDWRNTLRESGALPAKLSAAARYAVRAAFPQLGSWRRRLYHAADLLLPNSQAEAEQLMRLFQVPPQRIRVVPNGVDERFALADPELFFEQQGRGQFVLCPGRIEPRKNQLTLIRALHRSGLKVVILGDVVPGHEAYAAACRRAADEAVVFLGRVRHEHPLLGSAYAACSALAITSWYETPSLAALEAALTGAPLVLPAAGCAQEYFGPHAAYVSPHDVRGMRRAVLQAVIRPRSTELAALIRSTFTWRQVAQATSAAYETL